MHGGLLRVLNQFALVERFDGTHLDLECSLLLCRHQIGTRHTACTRSHAASARAAILHAHAHAATHAGAGLRQHWHGDCCADQSDHVKPFNPRELLARIKSILRRTRALPPNMRPESSRCLGFADWCLDTAARLLTAPDGVATPLSGGEYRLLHILLDHPNRVPSRDQLTEMIHGREAEAYDRAIDVQVSRLRQRLRDDSREPTLIKTVRGEGYVLAATVERRATCT